MDQWKKIDTREMPLYKMLSAFKSQLDGQMKEYQQVLDSLNDLKEKSLNPDKKENNV